VYKVTPTTKTTTLAKNNKSDYSQIENNLNSTRRINAPENSTNSLSQISSDFSSLTEMN
jgi:hypothetical protein